ncbi:MAG: dihydroxyacetone kinase subunit DhaK [Thermotogota bacterium]|nr:dihydroxyacetone kinase subunit DhaK [Thermotogota bacterium]
MKKIINNIDNLVHEMCSGIAEAFPDKVEYDESNKVVSRKIKKTDRVILISGGGSGHEPAHAGFVGKGLLDAAVCGDVFASPSVMQVYNAIKKNHTDKGVLLVVKNYAGDVMNFDNAADLAIDEDDIQVDSVCVNDDVAIERKEDRRGVAGTLFVHKIAGAMAEKGADLNEVKRVAEKVINNVRSMGIALESCIVPARGKPTFELEADKIEVGVGIHGEAGIRKEPHIHSKAMAKKIIDRILSDLPCKRETECALMINGFGGTPLQELYVLANDVIRLLKEKEIKLHRNMIGNYMTSIDMAGASISLLKLDEETKELLDEPCDSLAWKEF